jgi:KaiC/GvpD/RAD55 family RecA-like ATPase
MFFNILNLLIPKYNAEELTDFLNTNFKKLRGAGCGAIFCVDKEADAKNLSAIESLFDGVVEFQVREEKGKLNSYYRVREFRLRKMDSNWRRFK